MIDFEINDWVGARKELTDWGYTQIAAPRRSDEWPAGLRDQARSMTCPTCHKRCTWRGFEKSVMPGSLQRNIFHYAVCTRCNKATQI